MYYAHGCGGGVRAAVTGTGKLRHIVDVQHSSHIPIQDRLVRQSCDKWTSCFLSIRNFPKDHTSARGYLIFSGPDKGGGGYERESN